MDWVTASFISVPETTYPSSRPRVSLEAWIIRMSLKTGFLSVLLQVWILRSSLGIFLKRYYICFVLEVVSFGQKQWIRTRCLSSMHRPTSQMSFFRVYQINIYVIQPDTQCFMIEFIHNNWWLDMLRTSMVHPSFFLQPHNIWTYRVVRKIPHTKFATCS